MMNAPSITLLIPCFNASGQLPRLLEAAHNQTVPFAEIICYDDGSSDDTPDVAARWGARVIRGGTNRGVAVARSRLVQAARTQWVHFHDADDLMATNFVEVMSTHAAQVPPGQKTVIVCGQNQAQVVQDGGGDRLVISNPHDFCALNTTNDQTEFLFKQFVHLNTMLFPLQALQEAGEFCPHLRVCEDVDMLIRLSAQGVHFQAIPQVLVTRINQSRSLWKRTDKRIHYKLDYFARCTKLLSPRYHSMIGEEALFYSRQFYWDGQITDALVAMRLARRCGVYVPSGSPRHHYLIARLLGTESLFWLLKLNFQLLHT